jgi:hypothetical protein
MVVTVDAPPPAPRPFRLRAIDAVTVFLLLFGGIWAVVDIAVVIALGVAGGPFWQSPAPASMQGEGASLLGALIFLPLGMGLVGLVLLVLGLRRLRRLRAIYVHGQAVQATVTAVAATLMRVNGQRVMRVDYSFETITEKIAGKITTKTSGHTSTRTPPPVGTLIWVLCDSSDPQCNVAA